MQLWVQSDNPDYKAAVEERLKELRAKGEAEKIRAKNRERNKNSSKKLKDARELADQLSPTSKELVEGIFEDLLKGRGPSPRNHLLCRADPPKERGHLSDSQYWNGYNWERD